MSAGSYYVYILASRHHGTLYIGVTNDIRARLDLHRTGRGSKFVQKYKIFRLVHVDLPHLKRPSRARSNSSSGSGIGRSN